MNRASPQAGLKLNYFHSVVALASYSGLSLLLFGSGILRQGWENYRGLGADPTIHMWAMSWWPYAIAHHLNPLITRAIFAPGGYNLARAVSIPGPSVIIYPMTKAFGPVVAYNLLCLACPTAAAFSAFLLCRYLCHCFWPAFLGGYIFGFSQYVLSQICAHLFLLFIFPVPLAIYLVLRRIDGMLSRHSFVFLFSSIMGFEFLCSTELFATTTLFGAIALALALVLCTGARRELGRSAADVVLAYAVLVTVLSPYLYYVLDGGFPAVLNPAEAYSNDALAFVVPTPVLLGGNIFAATTGKFRDVWTEMAAYLGPGLWLLVALFARKYWANRAGKLLLLMFGLIAIASMGPKLHVAGNPSIRLPWSIAAHLPLVQLALPGRFGMYLFLVTAVIAALYLSSQGLPFWSKALTGVCAIAFTVPNLTFIWPETTRVGTPVFFRSGIYKRYVSRGDILLILPDTITSTSQALLWQAQTGFYFRSATGFYLPPEDYQRWPITASFVDAHKIPNFSEQLDAFLGAHQVKAIIVDGASAGAWPSMLSEAGLTAVATGGILFYSVPAQILVSFHNATAHEMAEKEAAACFGALVIAGSQYVDGRFPLAKLAPAEAHRLKLLTVLQDAVPSTGESNWWQNFWLGSWGGLVGVGVSGNYEDLQFLIGEYGSEAVQVFFPYPKPLARGRKGGSGQLLFLFTQQGVRRAARTAFGRPIELNEVVSRSFNTMHPRDSAGNDY